MFSQKHINVIHCDWAFLKFFLYYATSNERSQVDFVSFEVVTGQRKVEPLCRVCWVGALGGLRAAWSQRDPRLCFSVPDWSPEVFDLAPLAVCSGCFWDTNWPASKVNPFSFFYLCNFPSHICFIHLQMVIHNPSLYAVAALEPASHEAGKCRHSLSPVTFSCLLCDLSTGPKITLWVRVAAGVQRGYQHYQHHARSSKVRVTVHFVVIDLPLMCRSITLLRAMRSLYGAPQYSNGNLPTWQKMDVSAEHKAPFSLS